MVEVEVAAHGFAVECHEKDIVELGGHQPEACVRFRISRTMCDCRNALRKLKLIPEATRAAFVIDPGCVTNLRIDRILSSRE